MLSGDSSYDSKQREIVSKSLESGDWQKQVKAFYEDITVQLLNDKAGKLAGINQVDVTRE